SIFLRTAAGNWRRLRFSSYVNVTDTLLPSTRTAPPSQSIANDGPWSKSPSWLLTPIRAFSFASYTTTDSSDEQPPLPHVSRLVSLTTLPLPRVHTTEA